MSIITVCGVCFVCVSAVMIIRDNGAKSIARILSAVCALIVIGVGIAGISSSADKLTALIRACSSFKYADTILKAFCVAFVVEISSDCVRELGSENTAGALEFAGKAEILVLCIDPLLELLHTALWLIGQA